MNYLGYMWADRGENLPRALELIRKAVDLEPWKRRLPRLARVGLLPARTSSTRPRRTSGRRGGPQSRTTRPSRSTSATSGRRRATLTKARESWKRALTLKPDPETSSAASTRSSGRPKRPTRRSDARPQPRALRVAGWALAALFFFLEGGCGSGAAGSRVDVTPAPQSARIPLFPFQRRIFIASPAASRLEAYETARVRAWDPSRRFKALFRAEVSPKVGAIGRGYLSVWWDGRNRLPCMARLGADRGERKSGTSQKRRVAEATRRCRTLVLPTSLPAFWAGVRPPICLASSSFEETPRGLRLRIDDSNRTVLDDQGRVVEMRFPNGPRSSRSSPARAFRGASRRTGRTAARSSRSRATASWPAGEEVPPR